MMMKALLDTNVIIDFVQKRQPFYQEVEKIFRKIIDNKFQAYISASIATDIFYILQKNDGKEKALQFIKELVTIVEIAGIDKTTIIAALSLGWSDFEDAVQAQAAVENQVELIVTRNTKDFKSVKKIKILSPKDFIKII